MRLRVHRVIENTTIAGPGKRYCLWVQGCSRHCKGCLAVDTWDRNGGELFDTDELIQSILSAADIEGVTFLGGEPFEQAKALSDIGKTIKLYGLSVVTFTGYTLEEIQESNNGDYNGLLEVTDLLVDGAFQIEKMSLDRPWVGSSNQRYIYLSDRYFANETEKVGNRLEIRIYPNGKTIVAGMGDFMQVMEYLK